jgi:hypothetical protein
VEHGDGGVASLGCRDRCVSATAVVPTVRAEVIPIMAKEVANVEFISP